MTDTDPDPDRPTTRAVVVAEKLREEADRKCAADPYAKPYYPTTAAARQLVKRIANRLERETRDSLVGQPTRLMPRSPRSARSRRSRRSTSCAVARPSPTATTAARLRRPTGRSSATRAGRRRRVATAPPTALA